MLKTKSILVFVVAVKCCVSVLVFECEIYPLLGFVTVIRLQRISIAISNISIILFFALNQQTLNRETVHKNSVKVD